MSTFDRARERRAKVDERLSIGQSAAVVTGLSVISWGVVILTVAALRALF
jgi:hypothetical protein